MPYPILLDFQINKHWKKMKLAMVCYQLGQAIACQNDDAKGETCFG